MNPAEQPENIHPNDSEARTPQLMQSGAGNVDKIRDILFGSQMRDYETRFQRLEETVTKETAEIRESHRRRVDQLEHYIKREFEALESRLKAEREERTDAGRQHSRELKELGEHLTRRLRELDDRGVSVERDLRAHVLQQSKDLSDQMQQRHDEIFTLLEKRFQELRHGKTDRAALATLFTEVAMRLNDQFHDPGLGSVRCRSRPQTAAATGSPANGAGAAEFAELRRVLIGPELDQIAGIREAAGRSGGAVGGDGEDFAGGGEIGASQESARGAGSVFRKVVQEFGSKASARDIRCDLSGDGTGHPHLHFGRHPGIRGIAESDHRKERVVAGDSAGASRRGSPGVRSLSCCWRAACCTRSSRCS